MLNLKSKLLALAGALLCAGAAYAQDSGPLIDILVRKGLLNDQEAEELRAELVKDFAANTAAGKLNLSSSLTEFRIAGDLRVRYEGRGGELPNGDDLARDRFRPLARIRRAPAAGEAFDDPQAAHGSYTQEIELPGVWLERGTVRANDPLLLDSPLGWAGRRVLATMWFAAGSALPTAKRDALLQCARDVAQRNDAGPLSGATSPHAEVVIVRVLADRVEPAMGLLGATWAAWRQEAWGLTAPIPRIWRM